MTLKLNPFQTVAHNQTRMWRVWDHAVEIGLGAATAFLAFAFRLPAPAGFAGAATAGLGFKLAWFDWHRTTGHLLHWSQIATQTAAIDWPDCLSDLGLTLLGAAIVLEVRSPPSALFALAAYYALSTFNGT